jgi:transcriptional regulator with XRE-family HTH domain
MDFLKNVIPLPMTASNKSAFAQNLTARRKQLGLQQSEAAESAKLQRSTWGSYEEDRAEPCYEILLRITRTLGVPDEDLAAFISDPDYHKRQPSARGRSKVLEQYYKLKARQRLQVDLILGFIDEKSISYHKQNT